MFTLKVLVADDGCAHDECIKVKAWIPDLIDIISFEFITKDDPNWDEEYKNADITYGEDVNFYIPKNPDYAYIYSLPETGAGVDGLSYIDHSGGLSIVVRKTERNDILRLRFRHEILHWLGYPADAMSYYYFARSPTIMGTICYAIFGCKTLMNQEGNPYTKRAMQYQDRYYNICYSLCRSGVKADWENSDAPGWLKR